MQKTLEAIAEGFTPEESGSFVYKFGDGYELWLEQLLFDGQWYMALYKDQQLLIPKVVVKLGK